tara:strand:- start:5001 stop:5162 length:162 start_codon:yes stop_codon:yes gene_type:complete
MTRRQRALAEEETPLGINMIPALAKTTQEKIDNAEKRIEELQLLIKHWRKQNG